MVGSSAVAAHDHLITVPKVIGLQSSLEMMAPSAGPAPAVEALARLPLGSSAAAMAVPAASTRPEQTVASKASAPSSQRDPLRESLLLTVDLPPGQQGKAQEEGVMAVRAMTSSRGGSRSPELAPTPTPSPTPAPAPRKDALKPQSYKVAAGDTLLGIAYRFGITPETILWANDMGNGDLLQIGDELTILPVSGVLHKVKKGDTLSGIADAYGAEAAKIVEANLLGDGNALQEGQLLVIPGGMMRTTEPITGLPSAPSQQELAKAPKYVVKDGDTLLSIADAFGVRASVIQVANDLLDPDRLKIGQELSIPGGNAPASAAPQAPKPASAPAPAPSKPAPTAAPKAAPAPAPQPAPGPPIPAGEIGDRIAAISQKYLGYRYVWGGHSPSGFDCSGFTWYVYKEAGIAVPNHDLWGQLNAGPRIGRDQLQPGDLVFFQNTYKPGISHSGVYLGGGRFINAETEAVGVQIRSLSDPYWSPRFIGGSRPR